MKNLFENKIIDDLYKLRAEDFVHSYVKKYGKLEENKKKEKAEVDLVQFVERFIKDKEDLKILHDKIDKYEVMVLDEISAWYMPYYKLGFKDGIKLKEELQELLFITDDTENSNIYRNIFDILDFAEDIKCKNLRKNVTYNQNINNIENIKSKYPKVKELLEDEKITDLTKEEIKAILEIKELENEINKLGEDEMFKIGLREGKAL